MLNNAVKVILKLNDLHLQEWEHVLLVRIKLGIIDIHERLTQLFADDLAHVVRLFKRDTCLPYCSRSRIVAIGVDVLSVVVSITPRLSVCLGVADSHVVKARVSDIVPVRVASPKVPCCSRLLDQLDAHAGELLLRVEVLAMKLVLKGVGGARGCCDRVVCCSKGGMRGLLWVKGRQGQCGHLSLMMRRRAVGLC